MRRNLFPDLKEALHNIVKHSGASAVVIKVALKGHTIEGSICDNGKGLGWGWEQRYGEWPGEHAGTHDSHWW